MRQKLSAQKSAQNAQKSAVANARIAHSVIQQHAKLQLRPQNNFLAALEKSTRPTLVNLCRPCCL